MRLSIDEQDPGHAAYLALLSKHQNARVLLDGHELTGCVTADDDSGYVLKYQKDENGQPILNADRTEFVRVEQFGKVEILVG